MPFAFAIVQDSSVTSVVPDPKLMKAVQSAVREQIGAIASLGGMIVASGKLIPKTRSGKTLRRVLRDLVENAVHGEFEKEVNVPSTIEDAEVVPVAREKVKEYFEGEGGKKHKATEVRAKL